MGFVVLLLGFLPLGGADMTLQHVDVSNGLTRGSDASCYGTVSVSYAPYPSDALYLISVTVNPIDCSVAITTTNRAAPADFASARNVTIAGELAEQTGETLKLSGTYFFVPNNCPMAPQHIGSTYSPLQGQSAWAPYYIPAAQTFSGCSASFEQNWTLPGTTTHAIKTRLGGYSTSNWGCDWGIPPGALAPTTMRCYVGTPP